MTETRLDDRDLIQDEDSLGIDEGAGRDEGGTDRRAGGIDEPDQGTWMEEETLEDGDDEDPAEGRSDIG